MNFYPSRFFASLALGAALAGWPARAQQAIQYTTPVDTDAANKANAFEPETSARHATVGDYDAPATGLLGIGRSAGAFDLLPGRQNWNAVSPAAAQHWGKIMEARKNWMLSTPEDVLGLPTPEKILGLDEKNEKKLSPEARFLQRLDEASLGATTNRSQRADGRTDRFGADEPNDIFSRNRNDATRLETGGPRNFNQQLNAAPNSAFGSGPRTDVPWGNPFAQAPVLPKVTPEQLASMERFRAFMEPPAAPPVARPTAVFTPSASAATPALFNPAGRSYTPVQSNIGKPADVKPLSGITGYHPTSPTTKPTSSQMPPWLLGPTVNSPMQRRF